MNRSMYMYVNVCIELAMLVVLYMYSYHKLANIVVNIILKTIVYALC